MADIVVTNLTATPLGLYDVDGSYRIAGAIGGSVVVDPDVSSREIVDIYKGAGAATEVEAAAPDNTVAPVASGDLEVGDTVSVTSGTWTGTPTPVLTYQWQISDGDGWEDINGETGNFLVLTVAMEGEDVRCVVTGTNVLGTDEAESNSIGPVVATVPNNTVAPVASGTVEVGDTVSVTAGTWTGVPVPVLTYQWQVSDGENWGDIDGETGSSLELVADFVGEDVRCIVTGTNALGSDSATSNPLGPVTTGG